MPRESSTTLTMSYQPLTQEGDGKAEALTPEREKHVAAWQRWEPAWPLTVRHYISWRGVLEALLVVVTFAAVYSAYPRDAAELTAGEINVFHVSSHPVKFTASDYWLETDMFYNETILDDKMRRFKELSGDERGMIMVDDWQQYSLPQPQTINVSYIGGPSDPRQSYTIAYYHHVHCIATVAKLWANARMGVGHPQHDDEHMVHCLEVLRMAVMCLADTTFEDGENYWENTHQCRDHREVQAWAAEHAVWNFTAIIGERVDFL